MSLLIKWHRTEPHLKHTIRCMRGSRDADTWDMLQVAWGCQDLAGHGDTGFNHSASVANNALYVPSISAMRCLDRREAWKKKTWEASEEIRIMTSLSYLDVG